MDSVTVLLGALIVFLVLSLIVLSAFFLLQMKKSSLSYIQETKEQSLAQIELLKKMTSLLASKDPLAYQAIEAMETVRKTSSTEEEIPVEDEWANLQRHLAEQQYPHGKEDDDYDRIERRAISDALS